MSVKKWQFSNFTASRKDIFIYMDIQQKKQKAILGSTGSIGTQGLEVIADNASLFEVYALTANNNVDLLIQQAR